MSELLHFIQDREAAFRSPARLASLYSDFSAQKTLNLDGYTANLSAWKKALFHACRAGRIPSTIVGRKEDSNDALSFSTGEELGRALELRPYGRPTGLAEVIRDAVACKELVPLNEYLSSKESIYSRRWIPTPWEVVRWGLRSLGLGILYGENAERLSVGRFVVLENVEAAAKGVLDRQEDLNTSSTSSIYSLHTFTHTFRQILGHGCALSENDIQILLRYMSRDRPSLSYDVPSQTIKFAPLSSKPVEITENDISVSQIKTLALTLTNAIPPLESRYTELDARIRDAISKKQISAARSFLKSKKMVETTLEQRRANLLQVEESLHAIDTAATNVDIVHAMQESTKVMRDLNRKVGGVEGVERVTDALREQTDVAEDVGRILAEPGAEAVDDGEIEDEFEALLEKEEEKKRAVQKALEEEQARRESEALAARMRALEQWERAQREAAAMEAKRDDQTTAVDKSQETPVEASKVQESKTEEVIEETREGVKDMTLEDGGSGKRDEPMLPAS